MDCRRGLEADDEDFLVRRCETGRKLGDVLMVRCHEHARHLGIGSVWLTVWKNNRRAIRFYERWGFRKVGTFDFVVGRDIQEDFVLLKNIPTA